MKKDFRVAAIQAKIPVSSKDGEPQVKRLVEKAAKVGADLVGLPEDCLASYAEIETGYDALSFLSQVARDNKVYLFGATAVLEANEIHNRGFLFDRQGKLLGYHDKVVLTPPEEKDGVAAGKTLDVIETEFGKLALLVCKDSFHRYAAWFFDRLRQAGTDVVLIPSYSLNVSQRSVELWTDSLKALAKWFDMYVVAPGTIGPNNSEFPSFGHALIICPKRVTLAEGSFDKEEILEANLDVKSLEEIRGTYGAKWQPRETPRVKVKLW